jgi:hypothetical protein
MSIEDTLCYDGGAVKALGDTGLVGGFGVLFTDESSPDLQGEFFRPPPETDYDLDDRRSLRVLVCHGLDQAIGAKQLSRATFEIQAKGIWFQSQLDRNDPFQNQIYELVTQAKLGFSSGSAGHLVRRVPVGKAMKIISWPITELSVTPRPVETRARVLALKSVVSEWPEFAHLVNPYQARADEIMRKLEFQDARNWATVQAEKSDAYERERRKDAERRAASAHADFLMKQLEQRMREVI